MPMKASVAKRLLEGLTFELENLNVKPTRITMSPEFHAALGKPSVVLDVGVVVDDALDSHWKFY